MDRIIALMIQGNGDDIRCESLGQDPESGKWAGGINLYHGDSFHAMLVSSLLVFSSSEAAVADMGRIVREVRALDLAAN